MNVPDASTSRMTMFTRGLGALAFTNFQVPRTSCGEAATVPPGADPTTIARAATTARHHIIQRGADRGGGSKRDKAR